MHATRIRALVAAAIALAACDDATHGAPAATLSASASSEAPVPPRPPPPAPLPTSSGPEPKAPSPPELSEVDGAASVTFGFDPLLDAPFTVDAVRIKQRRRAGGAPLGGREILRTVERVTVTEAGEGYRWHTAPVSFSVHGERTSRVDELVAGFEVTYVLDASGAVTSVQGYDGLDEKAKSVLSPRTLKRVGPMLDAEALQRTRASEWRWRMADLVGKTVSLAEPLITVSEMPLPKGSTTVYGVFRFGPWLDCPPLGRCLRIEGYQHTSVEALAALSKVAVEQIRAAGAESAHGEDDPHDHARPPHGASTGRAHDHGHGGPGAGKPPSGPPLAMGIHSLRIIEPKRSLAVWERIEREIDLGMAQLSDVTTSSYDHPAKEAQDP